MKFLIYGAGAVGGYLGVALANAGHEVTLVSRSGADRINETGLSVITAGGKRKSAKPAAVPSLRQAFAEDESYDYLIMTMKAYDVDDAINEMIAFCPDPPTMVAMQNGIGTEDKLAEQFGDKRVIAGSLTTPLSYDENLNIVEEVSGSIAVASLFPKMVPKKIEKIFKDAGLSTKGLGNFASMKWSKMLINIMGNATSAITNRTPNVIYKYKPTFQLELHMIKEALAVMKALDIPVIDLPGAPAKKLVQGINWLPQGSLQTVLSRQVGRARGDKLPSFQIDLAAGKRENEVVYHNGAVSMIGREIDVPTPVNSALTDILLKIANEELNWEHFDGKPKEMIAAVNDHMRQARANS